MAVCFAHGGLAAVVKLLWVTRSAQRLGFSLAEINQNLSVLRDCIGPGTAIVDLLEEKLVVVDQRIAELHNIRDELLQQLQQERAAIPDEFTCAG